jgi:hypothetical protein
MMIFSGRGGLAVRTNHRSPTRSAYPDDKYWPVFPLSN